MLRFRRTQLPPPPVVAPQVNMRVSLLVEGGRYGGRVDDIVDGALVVAAPDANLSQERPVVLEWRDAAGTWQMPADVVASRQYPFPTTSIRPTGQSTCIAAAQGESRSLRVSARIVAAGRLPENTRVPVTTLSLRDGRLSLWTILPLERGDRLECVARLDDSRLLRLVCVVASAETQSGTWLVRAECTPEDPSDPSSIAFLRELAGRRSSVPEAA